MEKIMKMWLCIAVSLFAQSAFAVVIHVSTDGSDLNDGDKVHPVATLERALEISRQHAGEKREIILGDGVYYLRHTLVLTPEDNGLVLRAENAGRAVVSGGQRLRLKWKRGARGVWSARVNQAIDIDQLFINGKRQRMARYPNASDDKGCDIFDVWRMRGKDGADDVEDALSPRRVATWKNPAGGYVHAMHRYMWGDMHWVITEKVGADSVTLVGGWQNNRPSPMHPRYRFVENIAEELDAPGEWFYDGRKHTLYYYPEEGTEMSDARVEAVRLKHLVELRGTEDKPVRDIDIHGLVFRHAARTFMDNKEPLLRSDWTVYRGGAVVYRGAEDCTMSDCEFDQVGGNTVFVGGYNRRVSFSGCYIHDSGASGIVFVGDTTAVRNPRYSHQDMTLTDTVIGPRSNDYPAQCSVYDCLITRTGRDEKQTSPIQISMSYGIHVDHCSIYEVPRAGINISEGTFGGHVIENCDVFDTVLETGDHGSFNSWGRDRYWESDVRRTSGFLLSHHDAERWDMMGPNVLRHNRMRCDHGWDIDLDDGSSNYIITDNLLLNGGLKLREGKNRLVSNNVIVNNSLHVHVWYAKSGDVFTRNIVCQPYQKIGVEELDRLGWQMDANFFACSESDMRQNEKQGCDTGSLCGNPLFVDPAQGDYRVQAASDALRLGFSNFRMDDFGVVSPRLKAMARVPEMPIYEYVAAATSEERPTYRWNDIVLDRVEGDALSAYGVDLSIVGLAVVSLGDDGIEEKCGLRKRDLIIAVNGTPLGRKTDVARLLRSKVESFTVLRNQAKIEIKQ